MDVDAVAVKIMQKVNKLDGLPKIYYINLDDAVERNQHMIEMFEKYNITNFERYEAKRFEESKHNMLSLSQYGCLMSHLEVCRLIANSNDKYAIVFEDDVDISTIDKWNFTWNDFMSKTPEFDVLQLHRYQPFEFTDVKLKKWERYDHSNTAYIITKRYAKALIGMFDRNRGSIHRFRSFDRKTGPVADSVIYSSKETYSSCIFNAKMFTSSIDPSDQPTLTEFYRKLNKRFESEVNIGDIFDEK